MHRVLERLVADLLPQPRPALADTLAPRVAPCGGDRQTREDSLQHRDEAIADDADGEQGKSEQLQQDGERIVQDMDQDRQQGMEQLARGERDHGQRQDDHVVDAGAEFALRQHGTISAASRPVGQCLAPRAALRFTGRP
jgi:membrane peptidoglycan carboxypeptidase